PWCVCVCVCVCVCEWGGGFSTPGRYAFLLCVMLPPPCFPCSGAGAGRGWGGLHSWPIYCFDMRYATPSLLPLPGCVGREEVGKEEYSAMSFIIFNSWFTRSHNPNSVCVGVSDRKRVV